MTQSKVKVKVTSPLKLEIRPFSTAISAIYNGSSELTTDHGFLNYDTISKFERVGFIMFVLISVSRDFGLGRNVSCEESTISLVRG